MMKDHARFVGAIEANLIQLVDARGREQKLACVACPSCRSGLFIAICSPGLQPMHLNNSEALVLIEALRSGPAFQLLKASPFSADRKFVAQNVSVGRWILAYGSEGHADFIATGDPMNVVPGHSIAFRPEQRESFADVIFRELMEHATNVASA